MKRGRQNVKAENPQIINFLISLSSRKITAKTSENPRAVSFIHTAAEKQSAEIIMFPALLLAE